MWPWGRWHGCCGWSAGSASRARSAMGRQKKEAAVVLTAMVGWIIIGVIAGWLAGLVLGGSGFGVLGDMVIGLIGALIGVFLVRTLLGNANGANGGFLWSLLVSFVGAVLLLLVVRALAGGSRRRT